MSRNAKLQENSYFEFRNVSLYAAKSKTKLPFWIKKELISKDTSILDYGCGLGQTLLALKEEGYHNCYGVDIESNAISVCLHNNLDVRKLNTSELSNPFEIKFDIIILSHIIEHLPKDDIIETLMIIKSEFLKTNGKLLVAVPNAQSYTGSYWAYEDWTHSTIFTSGSLYYVLKGAGFTNVEFIDVDCTLGKSLGKKSLIKILLKLYKLRIYFWNKVTHSSYHKPSLDIYSYEIKAKAY